MSSKMSLNFFHGETASHQSRDHTLSGVVAETHPVTIPYGIGGDTTNRSPKYLTERVIEAAGIFRLVLVDGLLGEVPGNALRMKAGDKELPAPGAPPHRTPYPAFGKSGVALISEIGKLFENGIDRGGRKPATLQFGPQLTVAVIASCEDLQGNGFDKETFTRAHQRPETTDTGPFPRGNARLSHEEIPGDIKTDRPAAFHNRSIGVATVVVGTTWVVGCKNRNARSNVCMRAYRTDRNRCIRLDRFSAWRTGTYGAHRADRTFSARPFADHG